MSLVPQILETFIVELAFVVVILYVLTIDLMGDYQTLVTSNHNTCAQITKIIGDGWDVNEKKLSAQAEEHVINLLRYNQESMNSICIVDNDRNIFASYGKNVPDDSFYSRFSEKEFKENGIYFREEFSEMEDHRGEKKAQTDPHISIKVISPEDEEKFSENYFIDDDDEFASLKKFYKLSLFSTDDFNFQKKEAFEWATKNVSMEELWVMYKTEIEGVNVCIKKVHYQKSLDSSRHLSLIVMLLCVFAFIAIYEHYRLIVVIVNRRKIQKLIYTDPVTGGHNKDYFINKAKKLIRRRHQRYAVVYLRMEKYRNYIIAYGLKEGENLMEDFYRKLNSMLKKRREQVAHLEKSDFALLLNYSTEELLNIRMQSITNALNESRPNQYLYFSVGAARIVSRADDIQVKISDAGAAISKKTNIVDEVYWFDEAMREEQIWERRVEDDMDKALENHEFKVYLQPKYSTKKEELSAAEALVRWIHPEFGFVSPGKFIPIFERNGFITKLDDFMLDEVSKLQAQWLSEGKKLVPISVNVSRAHFSQYDLAEHICGIVDAHKVPHEFIELELTESAFFDDKQVLLSTVKKLKDYGFKVSMDDFGAGYSSLNSLKELPLDIIKLDAQFFRDIEDKKRADLIVCDTIKLAKKLGMQIVAEGIETREQVDFLAGQHCDLIQGFYFAKPLPIEEFEERAYPDSKKASQGNEA